MPARLYLRPQPRAFFLLTDTHALVFRQPGADESKATRSVVVAEFLPIDQVDTNGLVAAGQYRSVEGVLGVTSVPSGELVTRGLAHTTAEPASPPAALTAERSPVPDVFLLLLTASTPLAPLIPGSTLRPARVVSVEFHSLTSNFWDPPGLVPSSSTFDPIDAEDAEYYHRADTRGNNMSLAQAAGVEDPWSGMRKYLESGGFFHAAGCQWDISRHLGSQGTNVVADEKGHGRSALEGWDERFVWNAHLLQPLLVFRQNLPDPVRDELDSHALLLPVIQGFVGSVPLGPGSWSPQEGKLSGLALISRLSCKRAGARFRTRGIDDDGNVANFVETEVILSTGGTIVSYNQIRGSVPLFWQQPQQGFGTLQQKVEITRPPQATQPAFDKHFLDLLEHYGAVHAINLLGQKDAEAMLSNAYSERFRALKAALADADDDSADSIARLTYTPYDFHSAVRLGKHEAVRTDLNAMGDVANSVDAFGYTAIDLANGEPIATQHGTFRTNCLDCLDRTNYVQEVLSTIALRGFLSSQGSALLNSPTLWSAHRELWADNGDRLSKTYAGTGALNTSATRSGRKTFAGLISDATKSVGRAYINNFLDKDKQAAIDLLLGLMAGQRPVVLFDPVSDSVQSALLARRNEYSTPRNLKIFSGTWNVNGKLPDAPLDDWLFPGDLAVDIYAIAFQEIVELTPQQIVQPDPAKKRVWEKEIMATFSRHSQESKYIMLRSEQLVGTALMIIVKESLLPAIRGIEYASKKTGLQGLSGNKGGIGFRFQLYDATVCLMTCHLAAGQSAYADRNADYRTISNGLTFLRGKTIDSHDIVIWAADFNYRIDMTNEEVRAAAEQDEFDVLVAADQLSLARDDGEVFPGYSEGALTFRPTYKYDNGTDTYDSSEKQRIPAWTDRVLYKGEGLHLRAYNCTPDLRTSDHRPVYALFEAVVPEVDEARRSAIAAELATKAREASASGRLDDHIERAAAGGVRGLVKEFTSVSLTPSPARSAVSTPEPRHPPSFSRDSKPQPRKPNLKDTVTSAYARLGQPPPLPPRSGTSSPASVEHAPYEPRRRPAPPPPAASEFRKIGLPPDTNEVTPMSTGDFVLVPSPVRPTPPLPQRKPSTASVASGTSLASTGNAAPALPPRPRPTKGSTLDWDAPLPDNLVPAVLPDNRSQPKPDALAELVRMKEAEAGESSKPVLASKPPPPPAPRRGISVAEKVVDAPSEKSERKPPLAPKPRGMSIDNAEVKSTLAPQRRMSVDKDERKPPPLAPKPARKSTDPPSPTATSQGHIAGAASASPTATSPKVPPTLKPKPEIKPKPEKHASEPQPKTEGKTDAKPKPEIKPKPELLPKPEKPMVQPKPELKPKPETANLSPKPEVITKAEATSPKDEPRQLKPSELRGRWPPTQ